ncbi:zf-HC2 domain-containing protein [Marinibaculum pumilum]|uniref:Zf-HC2 domain-containing protein n=1 Tax=Marinibaculum pumilum TaxID=1766165 RepID=A0ABV7L7B2_9PROT
MSVDRPDEDLAARLGAYLDGELPPDEAAEVEGLLFRDAAAGQLYRGMKADRALLSADLNAAANRPAGDLLAVIDREFAARKDAPAGGAAAPRGRAWRPQGAAAADVLVVVIGGAGWWTEYRIGNAMIRLEASHETVRGEIQAAVSRALETQVSGQTVAWSGDGISGEVTPVRTYRSASGDWCREYLRSTRLQGRELSVRGLACRNADGVWVTVRAEPVEKAGDAASGGTDGQESL